MHRTCDYFCFDIRTCEDDSKLADMVRDHDPLAMVWEGVDNVRAMPRGNLRGLIDSLPCE